MNEPNENTKCVICEKSIKTDEKYSFSETNQGKILFFHVKCFENLKKKG